MRKKVVSPKMSPPNSWYDRIITFGFYLLFSLIPLLLTPWNYELFEFNKMIGVYTLTVIITSAWIIKMLSEKKIVIAKTPMDIPIALFVLSQLVSSIFSMDPHVSWFGYYSRFNGGMWSIFCYTLLYYAYLSNKTDEKNLVRAALITASFVALYGVLERLGIDKNLWVQDVQNRVFSTLGQPNWLAAYMVALIPLSMAFALKSQNSRLLGGSPKEATKLNTQQGNKKFNWSLEFGIWSLITTLFFTTLLFTKSRSGLVGFAIADMIFWGLTIAKSRIVKPALLVHAIFAIIIFSSALGRQHSINT